MMKNVKIVFLILIPFLLFGLWSFTSDTYQEKANVTQETLEVATFAGGCFWCMEAVFEAADGVNESISGYTGGELENPTYEQVIGGRTGHYEAVQVYFDPDKISYIELLEIFWRNINPTDSGGQFADRGSQYRTAIFYHSEEQRISATNSKKKLDKSGKFSDPIVTEIIPAVAFYRAEEYHQDYYKKNVFRYKTYNKLSGREDYLEETWENIK
jgi:peptide methionine sulfoxide reductase msrA/msrB